MKVFFCLFLCAVTTVSVISTEDRVNGENGWYVPQQDGSLTWMDKKEAKQLMRHLETLEGRDISLHPVTYYLYTKLNPKKAYKITASRKSILSSNFNPANPTRFVIHGWTQSYTAGMNNEIRDAWLSRGDYNIIIVDWARARSAEYVSSVLGVPETGKKVGEMIKFLNAEFKMPLDTLHVIGHSLGAHVAGHAGKTVGASRIHTIVGLDTAGPLFDYNSPSSRLSSSDASYVESIHTNGGTLGFLRPIGTASFYLNGGEWQPGCTLDVAGACSHGRSTTYYAEAVAKNSFPSMKCPNYEAAVNKNCGSTYSTTRVAAPSNYLSVTGIFYVPVNSKAPFGKAA